MSIFITITGLLTMEALGQNAHGKCGFYSIFKENPLLKFENPKAIIKEEKPIQWGG